MANQKPDHSLADAIASLKDTISRLPDAVSGSLANMLGRRTPGLVTDAATPGDAHTPAPESSGWGMFRSLFPSMVRYFARSDRSSRPGGTAPGSPEDALAKFLGRGNLDWQSFLAGAPAQTSRPIAANRGPVGAQFQPGDLSSDIEAAKLARAARTAMWGGLGHTGSAGSYSARRWAALQAMMGQGSGGPPAGQTIVGQAVPGQFFRRGWRPGTTPLPLGPIPTSFRAPGDFGRHGWGEILGPGGRKPFGYYDGIGARRPRRNWRAIIARHARSFGVGFGRGAKGFAASYRAGRAGSTARRGYAAHRRRSRVASARFAHGAARAFGSGSSTFTRFSGAGQMAGASLAKLAGAAGLVASKFEAIGAGGTAILSGFRALHNFAEHQFDANRRLGMYNPAISGAYNQVALGDMKRNWMTARENQGAIVTLARSVNAMRDALQPGESFFTGLSTRAGIVASEAVGSFGRLGNRALFNDLNRGMNAGDPHGLNTEAWIDRKMQDVHGVYGYLYGGFEYVFNAIRGNPQGANMRDAQIKAAQAWTEAEREAQIAAKVGTLPAWHASLNDMGNAGPFVPPRRVRAARRP